MNEPAPNLDATRHKELLDVSLAKGWLASVQRRQRNRTADFQR